MENQYYSETLYEKTSLKERFRDIVTLGIFTIVIALISIVVIDILVYPLTILAIKKTSIFNFLVTDFLTIAIVVCIAFFVVMKIRGLRREGFPGKEIALYMLKRPLYYFALFCFFILISAFIIYFLYIILNSNYHFLYRLTGN